ncbi:uncharacterized protein FIBRA_02554 [Fibroporia radiculosa]|uniref:Ribosome assembly protein 3 n=1 Tax=Fibroporia radiculosa TaxID=599839 RepID=J4GMZ1_9APHY|nr:uncharacterized protein FIBRA_02554 [Fibroporia radiculosa]CCM00520.1 predicted protein [Fibroporia radiculosa]
MVAPPAKPTLPRKRNRKRKRRAVSSSSSDDSDDSDSDAPKPAAPAPQPSVPAASSSSSSDSSSDDDSDDDPRPPQIHKEVEIDHHLAHTRPRSPSLSPPPTAVPAFLPSQAPDQQSEQILRNRFRKFWMSSVADAFRNDLEEIRKEPNMSTSRLALLIDSLASGADVFTASTRGRGTDINEMEVVLDDSPSS